MNENKNTFVTDVSSPTEPLPINQEQQTPSPKPSKWRYFFILLGILQILGVVLFFMVMTWAAQKAKEGLSGTEFVALFLYATLVPATGLIALVNLIGLPIYIAKHKPHLIGLISSIISLLISAVLALYGGYTIYQMQVAFPKQEKEFFEQHQKEYEQQKQQFAADNAKPEITKDEAIELLRTCQIYGFYYTNQTSRDNGGWGELSSTGIVLTKVDGRPYRISIADRLVSELVPIAREAQKTCGWPQFWYNNHYEQKQADGTWR